MGHAYKVILCSDPLLRGFSNSPKVTCFDRVVLNFPTISSVTLAGSKPGSLMAADASKPFLISFPPFIVTGCQKEVDKPKPPTMLRRPLSQHQRTYSWPPCNQMLPKHKKAKHEPLPDIDEDPFAHFLTPVTKDDDPFDSFSFDAGIEPEEPAVSRATKFKTILEKKWAQYVARHHVLLHAMFHEDFTAGDYFSTRPQQDRQRRNANTFYHLSPQPAPPLAPTIKIVTPEDVERELAAERQSGYAPSRGRAPNLLADAAQHPRRPRRASRTLSGQRHSWREPSEDIFTVVEEAEPKSSAGQEGNNSEEENEDFNGKRPDSGVWLF